MNNIDIVFLNTPIYMLSTNDGEDYLPPLGQGYIVTQLKKKGINAQIVDCVNERMGVEEIVIFINNGSFMNVALNVFSVNLEIVKSIVEKIDRKVNWFFGGKAMGHLWKCMLSWNWKGNNVTYTIGECDNLYVDLLLQKCVESPIFQNDNQCVYQVDKDSVYFPRDLNQYILDRELFKDRAIMNHYGKFEQGLIGSRGCIYNCAFCGGARSANVKSYARTRSSESIVREIEEIICADPRVKSIRILDDLFLKGRSSILQAIEIFDRFPQIHWRSMAHVNSLSKADNLFTQLKECGCDELFIGIESGAPDIRKEIHKLGTVENVIDVITTLLEVGIDVKGYFICGFPNENMMQMTQTVQLAKKLGKIAGGLSGNFRATAFQFRPYHGTELYDKITKEGTVIEKYSIVEKSSAKRQYSVVADNYSAVDDFFLQKCINEIMYGR